MTVPFKMLPPPVLDPTYGARGIDIEALVASIPSEVPDHGLTPGQVEGIGWDLAVFPERQQDIMKHYGLSGAQWVHLVKTPVFLAGAKHAAQALKSDPNVASRIVARNAMASAVLVAADLARSTLVEPRDRINAIKLLCDIVQLADTGAGAENRKAKAGMGGGGATINLNFGSVVGQALKATMLVERDE
ncbi:MAG: hypothetical protein RL260_2713 [Pseudomonadota bacterium]|jgi:hypothetical protein